MRIIILMFLIFIAPICNATQSQAKAENYSAELSLNQLLSDAEKFNLKRVAVYGKINLQAESYSLSTSGCQSNAQDSQGTIWLQLAPPRAEYRSNDDGKDFYLALKKYFRYHGTCVWVTGTYDRVLKGVWGHEYVGGIKDIVSVSPKKPLAAGK